MVANKETIDKKERFESINLLKLKKVEIENDSMFNLKFYLDFGGYGIIANYNSVSDRIEDFSACEEIGAYKINSDKAFDIGVEFYDELLKFIRQHYKAIKLLMRGE